MLTADMILNIDLDHEQGMTMFTRLNSLYGAGQIVIQHIRTSEVIITTCKGTGDKGMHFGID